MHFAPWFAFSLTNDYFPFRFENHCHEDVEHVLTTSLKYRYMQLLGILGNEILHVTITVILASAIFLQTFSMTILVKMDGHDNNWILTFILAVILIEAVMILIFLIGGMGEVCVTSKIIFLTLKKKMCQEYLNGQRHTKRAVRILCRSYAPIRICFGEINFIDRVTSLHCIDFANCLSNQCLLLHN